MDEADKEALKEGAATVWHRFAEFVDKFTELIFSKYQRIFIIYSILNLVGCLLGVFVWDVLRLSVFADVNMRAQWVTCTLICIMYLVCAALLFLSMREHEKTLLYFGFLKGAFAKSVFLLFATALIFPMKPTKENDSGSVALDGTAYINVIVGYVLVVASFL